MSESSKLPRKTAAGDVSGEGSCLMGVSLAVSPSVAQQFAALEHMAKDELDAALCMSHSSSSSSHACASIDIAGLLVLPKCPAQATLGSGEAP